MLVAVPLVVLIGSRPDVAVPAIPIEMLYTNVIVIAFICELAFRIYKDYFKKKK